MFIKLKDLYRNVHYAFGIKFRAKLKSSQSGSTFLVVVISLAVAVSLLAAVTTSVVSAMNVSTNNVNANQAYFAARSAVNATINYINDPTIDPITNTTNKDRIISALEPGGRPTTTPIKVTTNAKANGLADDAYVNISINSKGTKITLKGIGIKNGVTRSTSTSLTNIGILKNVFYSCNAGFVLPNVVLTGDTPSITACTNFKLGGTLIDFDTLTDTTGDFELNSKGNLPISVNNVYSNTNVKFNLPDPSNPYTPSRITVNNSLEGPDIVLYDCTVNGSVTCPKLVNLYDGSTAPNPSSNTVNPISATILPVINPTTFTGDQPTKYCYSTTPITSAEITTNTISSSGEIDDNVFNNCMNNNPNKNYTIDVQSHDIGLYFSNVHTFRGINFTVKGSHNLFIYIGQNSLLQFDSGSTIRSTSKPCHTFIFGSYSSSYVKINSTTLDAYIYNPGSAVAFSGTCTLNGNIISSGISQDATKTVTVNYKYPDIADTPLEDVVASTPSISNWVPGKWSN